jgi:hypothetical protein
MTVVLNIELDLGDVPAKLDLMVQRIVTLGVVQMPGELTEWQTDDMKRSFPNIDLGTGPTQNDVWAATSIWPRSRLSPEIKPGSRRGNIMRRSHRPILRDALLQSLKQRMQMLLFTAIRWH